MFDVDASCIKSENVFQGKCAEEQIMRASQPRSVFATFPSRLFTSLLFRSQLRVWVFTSHAWPVFRLTWTFLYLAYCKALRHTGLTWWWSNTLKHPTSMAKNGLNPLRMYSSWILWDHFQTRTCWLPRQRCHLHRLLVAFRLVWTLRHLAAFASHDLGHWLCLARTHIHPLILSSSQFMVKRASHEPVESPCGGEVATLT